MAERDAWDAKLPRYWKNANVECRKCCRRAFESQLNCAIEKDRDSRRTVFRDADQRFTSTEWNISRHWNFRDATHHERFNREPSVTSVLCELGIKMWHALAPVRGTRDTRLHALRMCDKEITRGWSRKCSHNSLWNAVRATSIDRACRWRRGKLCDFNSARISRIIITQWSSDHLSCFSLF